ncbi:hypothetical protein J6590_080921 [Homalodisca vitripennis]|nr:hypothetical protein J6590_080921 [Homalodisca vitripennis]
MAVGVVRVHSLTLFLLAGSELVPTLTIQNILSLRKQRKVPYMTRCNVLASSPKTAKKELLYQKASLKAETTLYNSVELLTTGVDAGIWIKSPSQNPRLRKTLKRKNPTIRFVEKADSNVAYLDITIPKVLNKNPSKLPNHRDDNTLALPKFKAAHQIIVYCPTTSSTVALHRSVRRHSDPIIFLPYRIITIKRYASCQGLIQGR